MESTATIEIAQLLDQAYEKRVNEVDLSIRLAHKALELSEQIQSDFYKAKSLSRLSLFHMIIGDFDQAHDMAHQALRVFESIGDEQGVADAKYTIAGTLYKRNEYFEGLNTLVDCLAIYKRLGDYHNQSRVEKSMGTIYEFFEDVKSAISVYESAVRSGEEAGDLNLQSNAFNPLSGIYLNQGKIAEAFELIKKSIQYKKKTGDRRGIAFAYYGRGKIYTSTGEYAKARSDLYRALDILQDVGDKLGVAMCYHKIGTLYFYMEAWEESKQMLINALLYSNKNSIVLIKLKTYYLLHEIAKIQDDLKLALIYIEEYMVEKETVVNKQTIQVIRSFEHIQEIEKLEQEAFLQKRKAEMIAQKNIELDSFFYRIAHDLRGPVTSLIGLSYLAKYEVKEKRALELFEDFDQQANRIGTILDSLMNLTKITFGEQNKQPIDFESLVHECVGSYKFMANFDKISFDIDVQKNIAFEAQWALINAIIQNLIENGIKYARVDDAQPWVRIRISSSDTEVKIVVADNGIGLKDEDVEKIFKMFFRASDRKKGSGIGLHILKRAVDNLGGKVEVASELGEGTTFTVWLPK